MEGARQGAEGEGSKEGADLLRVTEEDGHGWEYLCEWEGEQSDSWVWHDKMASVGYVGDLANTWERELMHAQGVRWQAASFREWLESTAEG